MINYNLPQGGIFNKKNIKINLPSTWSVNICDFPACYMKPLKRENIINRFAHPVGTKTIRELAKDKKDVVIIFDDISRGTKIFKVINFIIDELRSAGVKDNQVRLICATGSHMANDRLYFKKKVGEKILKEFPIYNHNPYENCDYIGKTSRGIRVMINSEVLKCDFKIAIGSIVPHLFFGFSGGGKIILPGVSSIDTIYGNHILKSDYLMGKSGNFIDDRGHAGENIMRKEIEEVCRMVNLDFIVNAFVNHECEIVDLILGDPIKAHDVGIEIAKKLYGTIYKPEVDLVIANANFKINEANIALCLCKQTLKKGGDIVIINHSQIGQVVHYLGGRFGKYHGGKLWCEDKSNVVENINKIILFNPYFNKIDEDWFGGLGRASWAADWNEVLSLLDYDPGKNIKVNLFSDATIQYFLES